MITGGSLLFPFINLFVSAIPYPNEIAKNASGAFAMLGSTFVFLLVYSTRHSIPKMNDANLMLPAWMKYRRLPLPGYRSVVLSSIVFILFTVVLFDYLGAVWSAGYGVGFNARSLVSGVLEYGLIFVLATLAFSVMAATEYMRQWLKLHGDQRKEWPSSQMALCAILDKLPLGERLTYPMTLSGFTVIRETRSKEDGIPLLEMTARSPRGQCYKVKIDNSGNVLEFHELESGSVQQAR